jgi:hypothetical protein
MLHVYAIVDSPVSPGSAGLHGAGLRLVGEEAPFAVASEHEHLPSGTREDDLWAHEEVVEALMEKATVLPMRFDATVSDEAELRQILDLRRDEFAALFDEVRGAVELGVRAQLSGSGAKESAGEPAPAQNGPGTAYLLERARGRRRAAEAVARVHEPLAALARRSRHSAAEVGSPGRLKAAYLVDRDRVDAFRDRVEALDVELGGGRIVCTGPWPPYGFSSKERR